MYCKTILWTILTSISASLFAQNRVPNPGFEDIKQKTAGQSAIENAEHWFNTNTKKNTPLFGTPDHMYAAPKSGGGYRNETVFSPHEGMSTAGVITHMQRVRDYREYFSVRLTQPLQIGDEYEVSCYITSGNNAPFGNIGTNGFGILLSEIPVEQYRHEPIYQKPHFMLDKVFFSMDWEKVIFRIKADRAYEYLTFGNFVNDYYLKKRYYTYDIDPQAYVFVDDVSVVPANTRPDQPVGQPPILADTRPAPKQVALQGRQVNLQGTFKVEARTITVRVWDRKEKDGDVISLQYNGEWILQNYSLKKRKKKLVVEYMPDAENQLIFFAHNLGTHPPNTAAILIETSKHNKRYLDIRSDMNYCGAIRFIE
jgi:hypothetical protein